MRCFDCPYVTPDGTLLTRARCCADGGTTASSPVIGAHNTRVPGGNRHERRAAARQQLKHRPMGKSGIEANRG